MTHIGDVTTWDTCCSDQEQAQQLGMDEVPVVFCDDLTDAQRRALTLADNQTTMMTGWDRDMLAYELDTLGGEFDMQEFGFDIDAAGPEPTEVSDVEPSDDASSRVSRGDVWMLGMHRLMCGDSTSADDVEKLMGGDRADICFTSPPYNAGTFQVGDGAGEKYVKKSRGRMYESYSDDLCPSDYEALLQGALDNAISFCDDAMFNIGFTSGALNGTARFIGANADMFAGAIIWRKSSAFPPFFPTQLGIMANACEPIYVFNREGTRKLHHPQWSQGEYVENVVETANSSNENAEEHQATFPVELASEVIRRFTSDSVLDLFGGTGTTLIAAEQLGSKCYMMEIDPHYCDIIIDRWERLTGRAAELA